VNDTFDTSASLPTAAPPASAATDSGLRPPAFCCEVRVAGRVTRYGRRGHGRPVLLLRDVDDPRDDLWPGLLDAVAAHRRVFLPEPPPVESGFVGWIRGFLDGVGLPPVTLIATNRYCLPAFELALLDPDRLTGLVLVPRGREEDTGLTGALGGTAARDDGVPVLVVRRDAPAAAALPLVEEFVAQR
jgi:pimeloyl-ACP methyl ester carboxylesterase